MAGLYQQLFCTTLLVFTLFIAANAHIQDLSRSSIYSAEARKNRTDYFTFKTPYQIGGNGWDQSSENSIEDARFVHDYLEKDAHSVYKFEITNNKGIVVAMPWVAACKSYEDSYVHAALLGPTSDPRFEIPTSQFKIDNNIKWELPAGYGAIFAIHPPVDKSKGQVRPTLNITLPEGEFPNAWYVPYNNGDQDPENLAFQRYWNDTSVGVLGCSMPPERCPGSPFPVSQRSPFCPHYKVGDYCGPKPWRWLKEREVQNGVYYIVFWEAQGKPVDYAAFLGFEEQLRMGRLNTTECAQYPPNKVPSACQCGSKSQLTLPDGCIALFPASRARTHIVYDLVVGGAVLHTQCNWVNNNPTPGVVGSTPTAAPTPAPTPKPTVSETCSVRVVQTQTNTWPEGGKTYFQYSVDLVNSGTTNANPVRLTIPTSAVGRIKQIWELVKKSDRSDGNTVYELPSHQTSYGGGVPAGGKFNFGYIASDSILPFKVDFAQC